jgi:hypothetical protein
MECDCSSIFFASAGARPHERQDSEPVCRPCVAYRKREVTIMCDFLHGKPHGVPRFHQPIQEIRVRPTPIAKLLSGGAGLGEIQIRPSARVESGRERLNRAAESSKRSQNISFIAWMEATPINAVSARLKEREPRGR